MNDNINGIIKGGKVYVANNGNCGLCGGECSFCAGCDFRSQCATEDFFTPMCSWLEADNFKFSQELTDKLNKQ